jgi:cyclase
VGSSTRYGMLKKRLIARLDIRYPNLIKPRQLEGVRVVGDPSEYAERYDAQGIDEIFYVDAVASLYGRNSLEELVRQTANEVFVPMVVAGGIRNSEDVGKLLRAGADKVAINTAAVERPGLISDLAMKFGSQCISLQLDVKADRQRHEQATWIPWTHGGREPTNLDAIEWAMAAEHLGAGEIIVTCIDKEGMQQGMDLDLIAALTEAVGVPVVASGGVGNWEHVIGALASGASGVAMAHGLHYGGINLGVLRSRCIEHGIPVRTTP